MTADIYKQIADEHYKLADLYSQLASETATTPTPASSATTFSDGVPVEEPPTLEYMPDEAYPTPETIRDQGSEAVCPKHRVPYSNGRYGPFCSKQTDDEAWGKRKPDGKMFCRITPSNAADYLRVRAAA